MANPSAPLTTVYALDEHIAVHNPDDFAILTPSSQCLAKGTDGVILSSARWDLTSATVDFEASGVASGHVVVLTLRNVFAASGECFAVDSVAGDTITLRRVGKTTGVGQSPGSSVDLSGITFSIQTLDPQIEQESFNLNREYTIDPSIPGRSPDSMYDLRDLRQACVLQVLRDRYLHANRSKDGDFELKFKRVQQALSDTKSRLQVRWAMTVSNILPPPSTFFSTRLSR